MCGDNLLVAGELKIFQIEVNRERRDESRGTRGEN